MAVCNGKVASNGLVDAATSEPGNLPPVLEHGVPLAVRLDRTQAMRYCHADSISAGRTIRMGSVGGGCGRHDVCFEMIRDL